MTRQLLHLGIALAMLTIGTGCATITPQRCAQIDAAASTVEQIAAVLQAEGIEAVRAQKLAEAVKAGRILWAVACGEASPPVVTSP